jgi:hypothetical protein
MTTNMITAARLIAHKSINNKYQSTMQMDKFPVLGHQMVCIPRPEIISELTPSGPIPLTATSQTPPTVLLRYTPVTKVL